MLVPAALRWCRKYATLRSAGEALVARGRSGGPWHGLAQASPPGSEAHFSRHAAATAHGPLLNSLSSHEASG